MTTRPLSPGEVAFIERALNNESILGILIDDLDLLGHKEHPFVVTTIAVPVRLRIESLQTALQVATQQLAEAKKETPAPPPAPTEDAAMILENLVKALESSLRSKRLERSSAENIRDFQTAAIAEEAGRTYESAIDLVRMFIKKYCPSSPEAHPQEST